MQETKQLQKSGTEKASLQFLTTFATDIFNIIAEVCIVSKEITGQVLRQTFLQSKNTEDISDVCLELFTHLVVFEEQQIRQTTLNFLFFCVFAYMDEDEKRQFYFKTIDKFLNTPETHFSQKAVIEALNTLKVPESDLILYMAQKLNLNTD